MRLSGSDGTLFEMSVAGYQFPDVEDEEYDSNWLLISVHVVQSKGGWASTGPCLLTDELETIANWFDGMAQGSNVESEQHFIEPNLLFRLISQQPKERALAIHLVLDSWVRSETAPRELVLLFPLSEIDPAQAAEELRGELVQYPQRAMR